MESPTTQDNTLTSIAEVVETRIIELPIEIHEYIIGFLNNEHSSGTIANCALVCRRWLPFSRFKLYFIVSLDCSRQWTAFEHLMELPASSNILGYLGRIRELTIEPKDDQPDGDRWQDHYDHWEKRPWTSPVLDRCAARLSGLTRLEFRQVRCSHPRHISDLHAGSAYHSLTILKLQDCSFQNMDQLHIFVTAFPALSDLTLIDITSNSYISPSCFPKGGHSMTRLDVSRCGIVGQVVEWLATAQLMRNLVHLNWTYWNHGLWRNLVEGINGPSLLEMDLVLWTDEWQEGSYSFRSLFSSQLMTISTEDLGRFTCLRMLHLQDEHDFASYLKLIGPTLSTISSDQFEELHISSTHLDVHYLDALVDTLAHLKAVDDILAHPQFSRLRRVLVHFQALDVSEHAITMALNLKPGDIFDGVVILYGYTLDIDLHDPQHPFKSYLEHFVRDKIRDELKQLNTRGLLEIRVAVTLDC